MFQPKLVHELETKIREALRSVYLDAGITLWLTTPNPRIWGLTPREAIENGEGERALAEAHRIAGV